MTYQHPQLAYTDLHCIHFFKTPLTIPCWHDPGSLEWIPAPLAWLTLRPGPKGVCLWLLDMSTDPPFYPICSKRVPIDWDGAEDSDGILKFCGSGQQKNWGTPPKPRPPPLQFDPYIYQSIALDAKIPTMWYLIDFTRAVQKLSFQHPPGVCTLNTPICHFIQPPGDGSMNHGITQYSKHIGLLYQLDPQINLKFWKDPEIRCAKTQRVFLMYPPAQGFLAGKVAKWLEVQSRSYEIMTEE